MNRGSNTSAVAWAILAFWIVVLLIALGCSSVTVVVGDSNVHEADKGLVIKAQGEWIVPQQPKGEKPAPNNIP